MYTYDDTLLRRKPKLRDVDELTARTYQYISRLPYNGKGHEIVLTDSRDLEYKCKIQGFDEEADAHIVWCPSTKTLDRLYLLKWKVRMPAFTEVYEHEYLVDTVRSVARYLHVLDAKGRWKRNRLTRERLIQQLVSNMNHDALYFHIYNTIGYDGPEKKHHTKHFAICFHLKEILEAKWGRTLPFPESVYVDSLRQKRIFQPRAEDVSELLETVSSLIKQKKVPTNRNEARDLLPDDKKHIIPDNESLARTAQADEEDRIEPLSDLIDALKDPFIAPDDEKN